MKRVCIIGGGPAGMSAALWLKRYGISPIIVEQKAVLGGQQAWSNFTNYWLLGQVGMTAKRIAEQYAYHMEYEGVSILKGCRIVQFKKSSNGFSIHLKIGSSEPQILDCDAVMIATGQSSRGDELLSLPGAKAIFEKGLLGLGPAIFDSMANYIGKKVAIIGGGDGAFENTIFLSYTAEHIDLIIRSNPRALGRFQERINKISDEGLVTKHLSTVITGFALSGNKIKLKGIKSRKPFSSTVDHVFSLIGYKPNSSEIAKLITQGVGKKLACDNSGYITVDSNGRTNIPGIYAVGDVCNPDHPCVATAISQGTIGARTIDRDFRIIASHL